MVEGVVPALRAYDGLKNSIRKYFAVFVTMQHC